MNKITSEQFFDYQIEILISKFRKDFEITENGLELLEKVQKDKKLAEELGKALLETIDSYNHELLWTK